MSAALWALGVGLALSPSDPRVDFEPYLLGMVLASVAWSLGPVHGGPSLSTRQIQGFWAGGLLLRALALGLEPGFSTDLYRHVYEGQVVWTAGWSFPYQIPPADAPAAGIPSAWLGNAWNRINHPEIATIYPPLAQLGFVLAGGLSLGFGAGPEWVKGVLLAVEVTGVGALCRWGAPRTALAWWTCPLVITEVAREGHADVWVAVGFGWAVAAARQGRWVGVLAGHGTALFGKLVGGVGLVVHGWAWRRWRSPSLLVGIFAAVWLATVGLPGAEQDGLTAYATRWRANDGVFRVAWWGAEGLLGGEWRRWGSVTVTRAQLARVGAALLYGVLLAVQLRGLNPRNANDRLGLAVGALLLVSPTFHPWYALWLVPFLRRESDGAPAWGPWIALLVAPLFHVPAMLEALTGQWQEWAGVSVLAHGLIWVGWFADARAVRRYVDAAPPFHFDARVR